MHEYQLRYLPQFHKDLKHHTEYIANKLQNPQAATDLIDATDQAILERLPDAEAFEPYHSRKDSSYFVTSFRIVPGFFPRTAWPSSVHSSWVSDNPALSR